MIDPVRGEIWRVNFDPTQGSELCKIRPAVVISDNSVGRLPLKIVVPITEWNTVYARYAWMTRLEPSMINGLPKTSSADAFQLRSLSLGRFIAQIGILTEAELDGIADSIALCIKAKMHG
ncbi:MAG: type II toxin-antitoxin system PemK/MazF family toxin [Janthinobacterium lividum]